MSSFFGKERLKRSRSQSDEESESSFIQNVTSSVSRLLPKKITKWFNRLKSSNANGSGPTADVVDLSTQHEMQENETIVEPYAKRMRQRSPSRVHHLVSTSDANSIDSNADTIVANTSSSTVHSALSPGRTTFERETNFVTVPLRSPNEEATIEKTERDTDSTFQLSNLTQSPRSSVATKRRSIFEQNSSGSDPKKKALANTLANTMVDPKQPTLKPSLGALPFYPARTMYGGASSAYMNRPNIKQRIKTGVNEMSSNETITMSSAARRVLEILEKSCSPLTDAKRMAPYVNRSSKVNLNSSLNSSLNTTENVTNSYKTQELHVPSVSAVFGIKQKSHIMDSTNVSRRIMASQSSKNEFTPYQPVNTLRKETTASANADIKQTMKVKSRITRPNRQGSVNLETDILEPVNLPSAVLQVDNLQTLSFGIPINSNACTSVSEEPVISLPTSSPAIVSSECMITEVSEVRESKSVTEFNDSLYKFSSPIRISTDSPQNIQRPKFTFGSPDRSIDKTKINKNTDCNKTFFVGIQEQTETFTILSTTNFKDPSVEKAPDTCSNFGIMDTTFVNKCSVCKLVDRQSHVDTCINCENAQIKNASSVPVSTSTGSSKWKCDDCWVTNDETVDKCVCCGAKCAKPGAKQSPSVASTNATLTLKPPDYDLKKKNSPLIQTQTDRWECPSCLVRNDENSKTCICCGTQKPGSTTEPRKFNFDTTSNTTFKFGIEPQEVNLAKQTEDKLSSDNISNVETNNNVLPKTVTFALSSPVNKDVESKADATKENASECLGVNFKFGIPKDNTGTIIPILKNTTKKVGEAIETTTEDKVKPQEVPEIVLTAPSTPSTSNSMGGLLGSPAVSQNLSDMQTSTPIVFKSFTDNKETRSNPPLQTATTSEETLPKNNTFTFLAGAIKPAVNLFGLPPSTTTSTSVSFASSAISRPSTTVPSVFQKNELELTSAVPLFQNNEPTTTSTAPLFQKSETTITTTAPPAAPSSIFSFGSNFVFGSNNNEPPPLFKPTFGATANKTDRSAENKIVLSTGNTLGTSNALSNTSSIGGGNGLPGNSIMGNALGGNGLPSSNALASGNTRPVNTLPASTGIVTGNGFQPGNTLSPTPSNGLFGLPAQKENVWAPSNLFVSNATTNTVQKLPTFTFGTSVTFNNNNPTPVFGNNAQPSSNLFGMPNQNMSSQPSMFHSVQNQPAERMFGASQTPNSPAPSMGMFGDPGVDATQSFITSSPSNSSCDANAHKVAFNFGSSWGTNAFGFGQQASHNTTPVYNFGTSGGNPQVQFNMGAAPNTLGGRRVRKAVRRNQQR